MEFGIFYNVGLMYERMLKDIKNAKKSIYLETYIYDDDRMGARFRKLLVEKAKEGVDVKVMVDDWGSRANLDYFKKLIDAGGQAREFSKFRYVLPIFAANHKRDHRKLLIIDTEIVYMGSANITSLCTNWRESVIRLEGDIAVPFSKLFIQTWIPRKLIARRRPKEIYSNGFKIIADIPSHVKRPTQREFLRQIRSAKKEIFIETPYFVPPFRVRQALRGAAKRGVDVRLMTPHISDVRILDIVKEKYFGRLYNAGVRLYYYLPKVLHSKVMIVDGKSFIIGSSNIDYRSFVYQYEVNLSGDNKRIADTLRKSFLKATDECKEFDYTAWENRPLRNKLFESFLSIFKRIL